MIVEHYQEQIKYLDKNKIEENLKNKIKSFAKKKINTEPMSDKFIKEEDLSLKLFKGFTKGVTKMAIEISKKL